MEKEFNYFEKRCVLYCQLVFFLHVIVFRQTATNSDRNLECTGRPLDVQACTVKNKFVHCITLFLAFNYILFDICLSLSNASLLGKYSDVMATITNNSIQFQRNISLQCERTKWLKSSDGLILLVICTSTSTKNVWNLHSNELEEFSISSFEVFFHLSGHTMSKL